MATQTFNYRVRDTHGKIVEGELDAENKNLVAGRLREMGYTPISVDKKQTGGLKTEIKIPGMGGRIKPKELAVFSRQFATMINSGLSLLRSLDILAMQTDNKALAKVIEQVGADVEGGSSLSGALGRHPKVFSPLYVSMIKAGEAGGVLDTVLMQLASTLEKAVELRQKIKSAMTYPVAVLVLVLIILTAMLVFVVPMFDSLYSELGGELPKMTQLLLTVSRIVTTFFPFLIIATVIGVFLMKRWLRTSTGRRIFDKAMLKAPVFGSLIHKTALARFSRTLESLLKAGVPILESLEITADTVGNVIVKEAVLEVREGVKHGEALAKPMADMKVFPPMVGQMMAVGEETGALDDMLGKIGEFYEQEVEATVAALTSLLEPLLIVVLGGTVGGMVIALYMPMFNIINLLE
jgi:type IV pilus assembly protein PilC